MSNLIIGTISDPIKFIGSHLAYLKGYKGKKKWTYYAYYDRLKQFCVQEGIDFETLLNE